MNSSSMQQLPSFEYRRQELIWNQDLRAIRGCWLRLVWCSWWEWAMGAMGMNSIVTHENIEKF